MPQGWGGWDGHTWIYRGLIIKLSLNNHLRFHSCKIAHYKSHDLQYHFYADDTQLYITFKTDSADDACLGKSRVEHCVEEIDRWMISNKLKLNDDKTEFIVFSSKFRPRPCLSNVQIGSECIEHSNTVRNLGVLFDQTLSFGNM